MKTFQGISVKGAVLHLVENDMSKLEDMRIQPALKIQKVTSFLFY